MSLSEPEPTTAAEIRARARAAHERLMGPQPNVSTRFFYRTREPKTSIAVEHAIDEFSRQHLTEAEELIAKLRTFEVALHLLAEAEETVAKMRRPVHRIIRATCRYFGMQRMEMLSSRRTKQLVRRRQIAMFLSRELTPCSLPEIGRRFGGRDHTTILHACRTVERLCRESSEFADDVAAVRALAIKSDLNMGEP